MKKEISGITFWLIPLIALNINVVPDHHVNSEEAVLEGLLFYVETGIKLLPSFPRRPWSLKVTFPRSLYPLISALHAHLGLIFRFKQRDPSVAYSCPVDSSFTHYSHKWLYLHEEENSMLCLWLIHLFQKNKGQDMLQPCLKLMSWLLRGRNEKNWNLLLDASKIISTARKAKLFF